MCVLPFREGEKTIYVKSEIKRIIIFLENFKRAIQLIMILKEQFLLIPF